jgi:hypothetical protein
MKVRVSMVEGLVGIRQGVGLEVGCWFNDNMRKLVGNGVNPFFWSDPWLDGVPLSVHH